MYNFVHSFFLIRMILVHADLVTDFDNFANFSDLKNALIISFGEILIDHRYTLLYVQEIVTHLM